MATKLLGKHWGVLSGCALLVDYVLTITISIASGADAIFSLLPPAWANDKLPVEVAGLVLLTIMNIRGVKESVTVLVPIFMTFVVTHAVLLVGIFGRHVTDIPVVSHDVSVSIHHSVATLGMLGTVKLFIRAYSLGGGTYTGIEAVSKWCLHYARAPRPDRAPNHGHDGFVPRDHRRWHRALLSASPRASGCDKTMNAVMFEQFADTWTVFGIRIGHGFVWLSLLSEELSSSSPPRPASSTALA